MKRSLLNVAAWDGEQLDWQPQCPQSAACPDITWFWAVAAALGILLVAKKRPRE